MVLNFGLNIRFPINTNPMIKKIKCNTIIRFIIDQIKYIMVLASGNIQSSEFNF